MLATSSGVATNDACAAIAREGAERARSERGHPEAREGRTDGLSPAQEMRGEGLDLPSGWVETAAARLRPGAAASIFGDARQTSLERKEQRKTANNWATTLALASSAIEHAKIGGGARIGPRVRRARRRWCSGGWRATGEEQNQARREALGQGCEDGAAWSVVATCARRGRRPSHRAPRQEDR